MARLNWDRLRRARPLDGADAQVDPDGTVVWKHEHGSEGRGPWWSGVRRLREGVVVRSARARREADEPHVSASPQTERSSWSVCPRCGARVAKRKLLLHARAECQSRPNPSASKAVSRS